MTRSEFPPDFQPIVQTLNVASDTEVLSRMDKDVKSLAKAPADKFKTYAKCLSSLHADPSSNPRTKFFLCLLVDKLVRQRGDLEAMLFDKSAANNFCHVLPINLQDVAVSNYKKDATYNYAQRLTNVNLEFIAEMAKRNNGSKGGNAYLDFVNKNKTLFPRKTSYLTLSNDSRASMEEEYKQLITKVKDLRRSAVEEIAVMILSSSPYYPHGKSCEDYFTAVRDLSKCRIAKADADLLKIMELQDMAKMIEVHTKSADSLKSTLESYHKSGKSGTDLMRELQTQSGSNYPESNGIFQEFDEQIKLVAPEDPAMNTSAAALINLPAVAAEMMEKHYPNHNFILPTQDDQPAYFEEEQDKFNIDVVKVESSNRQSQPKMHNEVKANPAPTEPSHVRVSFKNSNKNMGNYIGEAPVAEQQLFQSDFMKKGSPHSYDYNGQSTYQSREDAEKVKKFMKENEELEQLVMALEQEKRICENSILDLNSRKHSTSKISAISSRSNRSFKNKDYEASHELIRILKEKDDLVSDLQWKYESLKDDFEKSLEQERELALDPVAEKKSSVLFSKSRRNAAREETRIRSERRSDYPRTTMSEGVSFLQDLYKDIDMSLRKSQIT